jgi:hypothetical protein
MGRSMVRRKITRISVRRYGEEGYSVSFPLSVSYSPSRGKCELQLKA